MDVFTPNIAVAVERDGYAVVADVVGPEVADELVAALDRARSDPSALRRGESTYGMRDLLRRVPAVRRLAGLPTLRRLVEEVLGPGGFAVRGLLFDKAPEANWGVPWHRDTTIAVRRRRDVPGYGPWTVKAGIDHVRPPSAVLRRMLTLRVHLDDCGPRNGPLCVLPGSHALDDVALASWRERVPVVTCPVGRGGVLLMRPLLLHASASAEEPTRRRVVHLEYASETLPGGLEWFETSA